MNNDPNLGKAFENIISRNLFNKYILDISRLVSENKLSRESVKETLYINKINKIEDIKVELLDLIIEYINVVLKDNIISEIEKLNVKTLKRHFNIKEGDFYRHKLLEVENIIKKQFELIYSDNIVTKEEAIHKVELQAVFDLSYDQFNEIKEKL